MLNKLTLVLVYGSCVTSVGSGSRGEETEALTFPESHGTRLDCHLAFFCLVRFYGVAFCVVLLFHSYNSI